ncbi:XisI protein [Candidatus Vecturithrix granuli]|uniref:XisI protein n=1 Tax=Vecturithrix granuli TaxID=1499967 RepID=A0A081C4I1_VECG1|nr:XisI protein [Candidatus Vecturithrix granuli]
MDTLETYRQTIQSILTKHANVPYAYGDIYNQTIFEYQHDSYLLLAIGWQKQRRIHHCLVHTEIIDGKIWIQLDGTEQGIANELIEAGIPKEKIVLGFHPPEIRKHTGFAVG